MSEHDSVADEPHRPVRKRRQDEGASQAEVPLQLVETQVEAAPISVDDDLPRRTKPRRRRGAPVENAPLMLVETQGNTEPGDTPSP